MELIVVLGDWDLINEDVSLGVLGQEKSEQLLQVLWKGPEQVRKASKNVVKGGIAKDSRVSEFLTVPC
jgi:hypothetical protein